VCCSHGNEQSERAHTLVRWWKEEHWEHGVLMRGWYLLAFNAYRLFTTGSFKNMRVQYVMCKCVFVCVSMFLCMCACVCERGGTFIKLTLLDSRDPLHESVCNTIFDECITHPFVTKTFEIYIFQFLSNHLTFLYFRNFRIAGNRSVLTIVRG
jgi:hypothetical protein